MIEHEIGFDMGSFLEELGFVVETDLEKRTTYIRDYFDSFAGSDRTARVVLYWDGGFSSYSVHSILMTIHLGEEFEMVYRGLRPYSRGGAAQVMGSVLPTEEMIVGYDNALMGEQFDGAPEV